MAQKFGSKTEKTIFVAVAVLRNAGELTRLSALSLLVCTAALSVSVCLHLISIIIISSFRMRDEDGLHILNEEILIIKS